MNPLNTQSIEQVIEKHSSEPWVQKLGGSKTFSEDPLLFMMRALVARGMNNYPDEAYQRKEAYPSYILERISTINKKNELIQRLRKILEEKIAKDSRSGQIRDLFDKSIQTPAFHIRLERAIYYIERTEFLGCGDADKCFRAAFDVIQQAADLHLYEDPLFGQMI